MRSKTVLVVDDDKDFLDLVSLILKRESFRVLQANSADECLAHLQTQEVDMIVTDISMPKVNGLQLTKVIREMDGYGNIPIMLLTGGVSPISFADFQFRADAFCMKDRINQNFVTQVSTLLAT